MKTISFIIVLLIVLPLSAQVTKLGTEITIKEKTEISAILSAPEEYTGKKVLVRGEVIDVCRHAGCWMEVAGDKPGEKIKVKVKDGDIVFPVEAIGQLASVEGEVYAIEMDKDEALEYYEHAAEDAGKEFDPSIVTGPVTIYQIKGLGAEINRPETAPDKQQE